MVTEGSYPILEFDPSPQALMEPSELIAPQDVPEHCVLCFFAEVISGLAEAGRARQVACLRSEMGQHPIYEMEFEGRALALFHPRVGAPLAAASLEGLIAIGCRKFVACGGAGVVQPGVPCGRLIVPVAAVRDEGTSYHYLPPAREVEASREAVGAITSVLERHGCQYILAKTWTTDAFYRETPARIARRRAEGCVTVEMEAAALFAVAQFRGVPLAQILYGGDDCSGAEWDSREWHLRGTVREELLWLAAEACLRL